MTGPDLRGWTARKTPGNQPMEGRLVRIVALDAEAHWRGLWAAFGGGEGVDVWTYMSLGPFSDEASFLAGMRWIENRSPDWVPFAILDKPTGRAFGTVRSYAVEMPSRSGAIRQSISRCWRRSWTHWAKSAPTSTLYDSSLRLTK